MVIKSKELVRHLPMQFARDFRRGMGIFSWFFPPKLEPLKEITPEVRAINLKTADEFLKFRRVGYDDTSVSILFFDDNFHLLPQELRSNKIHEHQRMHGRGAIFNYEAFGIVTDKIIGNGGSRSVFLHNKTSNKSRLTQIMPMFCGADNLVFVDFRFDAELAKATANPFKNTKIVELEKCSFSRGSETVISNNIRSIDDRVVRLSVTPYNEEFEPLLIQHHDIYAALTDYATMVEVRFARAIAGMPEKQRQYMADLLVYDVIKREAIELLRKDLTRSQQVAASNYWHLPYTQMKSRGLRKYEGQTWLPLIEGNVPISCGQGMYLKELTNGEQLTELGREQRNCAATYIGSCVRSNTHFMTLCNKSGEVEATIRLERNPKTKTLDIKEIRGFANANPSRKAQNAARWFVETYQKERDYPKLESARSQRVELLDSLGFNQRLENKFGFDPLNQETYETFRRNFRTVIIPHGKYEIPVFTDRAKQLLSGKVVLKVNDKDFVLEPLRLVPKADAKKPRIEEIPSVSKSSESQRV